MSDTDRTLLAQFMARYRDGYSDWMEKHEMGYRVELMVRDAIVAGRAAERADVLAFCTKMAGACSFDVVVGSGWMAMGDAVERGDHEP